MDYSKLSPDDLEILGDFVEEADAGLTKVKGIFRALAADPAGITGVIDDVFCCIHSIKGNSAFLGLLNVKLLAHEFESVLGLVRRGQLPVSAALLGIMQEALTELADVMGRIRNRGAEVVSAEAFSLLVGKLSALVKGGNDASKPVMAGAAALAAPVIIPVVQTMPSAPAAETAAAAEPAGRSLRVAEETLVSMETIAQGLHDVIFELLSAQTPPVPPVVETMHQRLVDADAALLAGVRELCSMPARQLLARAPRIVADVCRATGKNVQVRTSGEEIRLHHSTISALETALLHILRNAVDHGIEDAAARTQAGKSPVGNLAVELTQDAIATVLTIRDDGGGVDFRTLIRKANETGAWPKTKRMTPEDVPGLLFLPGLSTASQVTDVSGRGVGLDAVKKGIEAAGGTITLASKRGEGVTFTITFPAKDTAPKTTV